MSKRLARPMPSAALEELLLADKAAGVDIGLDARPAPAPPMHTEPLRRPVLPDVNWREEIEEQARRAAVENEPELEPEPESYPAKPKRSDTPNLDKVKRWFPKGAP